MSWRASGKAKMIQRDVGGQMLTAQDKLLLMVLSDDYNEESGCAWRSQPKLADMCFCTDRGIRFSLQKLERAGLIQVVHGGRFGNEYRLLFVSEGEKSLRNTVPQSTSLTGTGVPVGEAPSRNVAVENKIVSIKELEPTIEPPPLVESAFELWQKREAQRTENEAAKKAAKGKWYKPPRKEQNSEPKRNDSAGPTYEKDQRSVGVLQDRRERRRRN